MTAHRPAADRGHTRLDWLDSRHSFAFGGYQDPEHTGLGPLRVINDDRVVPGAGFGRHPHRDMEIITYVLAGALEHQDSTGGGGILRPGEIQVMSAGSGIFHSEFNASETEPVHFLQIWIVPAVRGAAPRYDQRRFPIREEPGRWHLIAGPEGNADLGDALPIRQHATLRAARLEAGAELDLTVETGRQAWLQIATGSGRIEGPSGAQALAEGDGIALTHAGAYRYRAEADGEVLCFDLPR